MTTDARATAVANYPVLQFYIDGIFGAAQDAEVAAVIDPTSEEVLGSVPLAGVGDLDRAIAAGAAAAALWRNTPAIERARALRRVADWLRARRDEWAGLITLELGKPLPAALAEVETACEMFEWAAEEARRVYGRTIPARITAMRLMTVAEPIGLVAAISGWNAPAITPARKIAGAVGAGCTIVIKPSEATPATALMIARAFDAAQLPAGVLNMIFGDPPTIGQRFATDPEVHLLTFTGGTAIGKDLARLCSGTLKRTILELGGHAPVLVFADADIAAVATAAAAATYRNTGQVCTSPTRFVVQYSVLALFTERFTAAALALKVGDPFASGTQIGPVQNARRAAAVRAMISNAQRHGATVVTASAPEGPGFWVAPTVLSDVPQGADVWHDEPFGPIAVITGFDSTDDAIAEANRLPFGLAAYAFTSDVRIVERLTREVQCGSLAINHWAASFPETPFGGVKDSGIGAEGGIEGMAAFLQQRFVSVAS